MSFNIIGLTAAEKRDVISSLQALMAFENMDVGSLDGKWGPSTEAGVAQLQRSLISQRFMDDIPKRLEGTFGPSTLEAVYNKYSNKYADENLLQPLFDLFEKRQAAQSQSQGRSGGARRSSASAASAGFDGQQDFAATLNEYGRKDWADFLHIMSDKFLEIHGVDDYREYQELANEYGANLQVNDRLSFETFESIINTSRANVGRVGERDAQTLTRIIDDFPKALIVLRNAMEARAQESSADVRQTQGGIVRAAFSPATEEIRQSDPVQVQGGNAFLAKRSQKPSELVALVQEALGVPARGIARGRFGPKTNKAIQNAVEDLEKHMPGGNIHQPNNAIHSDFVFALVTELRNDDRAELAESLHREALKLRGQEGYVATSRPEPQPQEQLAGIRFNQELAPNAVLMQRRDRNDLLGYVQIAHDVLKTPRSRGFGTFGPKSQRMLERAQAGEGQVLYHATVINALNAMHSSGHRLADEFQREYDKFMSGFDVAAANARASGERQVASLGGGAHMPQGRPVMHGYDVESKALHREWRDSDLARILDAKIGNNFSSQIGRPSVVIGQLHPQMRFPFAQALNEMVVRAEATGKEVILTSGIRTKGARGAGGHPLGLGFDVKVQEANGRGNWSGDLLARGNDEAFAVDEFVRAPMIARDFSVWVHRDSDRRGFHADIKPEQYDNRQANTNRRVSPIPPKRTDPLYMDAKGRPVYISSIIKTFGREPRGLGEVRHRFRVIPEEYIPEAWKRINAEVMGYQYIERDTMRAGAPGHQQDASLMNGATGGAYIRAAEIPTGATIISGDGIQVANNIEGSGGSPDARKPGPWPGSYR